MRIQITQKFRPFSLRPGTRFLVPFTTWEAQIFPTKVFLSNLLNKETKIISMNSEGKKFIALQDFEKGRIFISGKELKTPPFCEKHPLLLSKKRLFMGIHKKQDWEMITRRLDMAEIFPFWIQLAQIIPQVPLPQKTIGTMHLLHEKKLDLFFQAAFQGILCPRLKDENYLGLIPDIEAPKDVSPLGLLHEGARQIENLFFHEENDHWHFLPHLPKELHAGRFIHLQTPDKDELDMEWSKKQLKKVIIRPKRSKEITLVLKKGLKSFRIRKSKLQRGEINTTRTLVLKANQTLYLDRFSK